MAGFFNRFFSNSNSFLGDKEEDEEEDDEEEGEGEEGEEDEEDGFGDDQGDGYGDDENPDEEDEQAQQQQQEQEEQEEQERQEQEEQEQQQQEEEEKRKKEEERQKKEDKGEIKTKDGKPGKNAPDNPKVLIKAAKRYGYPPLIMPLMCPDCKKFSLFADKYAAIMIRGILAAIPYTSSAMPKDKVFQMVCLNKKCKCYWPTYGTKFTVIGGKINKNLNPFHIVR